MKKRGEKIAWVTSSDFSTSLAAERGGAEMQLIGDSSFMTQYGFPDTKSATMDMMIFISQAVARGAKDSWKIGDMPIASYDNPTDAAKNALRFKNEANCQMIKLEGRMIEQTKAIVAAGVPVCAHLGLQPQTSTNFNVFGKTLESFESLVEDAVDMQNAGASMVLLEAIPPIVSKAISLNLDILTLGIGCGKDLDGNLIIQNDLLGYYPSFRPTFVKCFIPESLCLLQEKLKNIPYDDLQNYGRKNPGSDGFLFLATEANRLYTEAVKAGIYPEPRHNYKIKDEELAILKTSKYWKEQIENIA